MHSMQEHETNLEEGGQLTAGSRSERSFGLDEALRSARVKIEAAIAELGSHAATGSATTSDPFFLDSKSLCLLAYTSALGRVRERFWTTSFLASGFWTTDERGLLKANLQVLDELRESDVACRRLFLLPRSTRKEIEHWLNERIVLQKDEDEVGLKLLDEKFERLCRNIERLREKGCDIRVVHDEESFRNLSPEIGFDHRDSELAIYDDWRFDIFSGGSSGRIESVRIFTPIMVGFMDLRDRAAKCFEAAWARARPISHLLEGIRETIEYSAARITYLPAWLARYDHGLPEEDRTLKIVELSGVKTELIRQGKWGKIRRFLDVGTCTGRYPISLRSAICEQGEIVGIDNDIDSVRFARWNIQQQCETDSRMKIIHEDFCAERCELEGHFDLITCMLGTLVHFAHDRARDPSYGDLLQRALQRFSELLTADGLFFFSVWSEKTSENLKMLSIYSEEDKRRLASWTPTQKELEERLRAAGFNFLPPLPLEDRMDLYCCYHDPAHASPRPEI